MAGRVPRLVAALALAFALVSVGQAGARVAGLPTLYVAYTINCTFTIVDDAHKPVSSIAPGTYQVLVSTPVSFGSVDLAGITDMTACTGSTAFQLTGPGVNLTTTLNDGDSSSDLLSATFQKSSTYVAVDNHNPTVTRTSFTTTATGTPTAPTSTPTTTSTGGTSSGILGSSLRGTLTGAVSATGKVTLKIGGKVVTRLTKLKSGTYTFVITDSSKKTGFVLQQLHKAATTITAPSYTGTKSVTITLSPGQWSIYATFIVAKTSFTVTA